jgi:YidC/Oxa1 family membrane protein insertase
MLKDKKTILVVVGCMLALIGWQMLIAKLYKPIPKATKAAPGTNEVAVASNVVAQIVAATNEPPAVVEEPRGPEQTVVLSNAFVRLTCTSWGGGIRAAELLQHRHKDGAPVVLETGPDWPALAVVGSRGPYQMELTGTNSVSARGRLANGATVVKEWTLGADYLVTGKLRVTGAAPTQTVQLAVGQIAPLDPSETPDSLCVDWLARRYENRTITALWVNNVKQLYHEPASTPWGAVKNRFFTWVLTPSTNAVAIHYHPHRLETPPGWSPRQPRDGLSAALELPAAPTGEWGFQLYVGPKEYDRLNALGRDQDEVMQFGFWGFFSVVLLKTMNFCYGVAPNYGIAIIIITVLIKLLFWPVQAKSIHSMKEMQKFQPLMQKVREKYKDDPQRQQQELMKLYKEHKINPFSGCLPMLVQIPVFFALFAMLKSAIELRGASFLWIGDLSQPDTIFHLFGLAVNPLPLLMTAASIWQMKLTPQTGDNQQQKMMMFMPLIFLFMFYSMSSGLVLYWTVQQLLSVGQQWWSLRQPATA